MRIVVLVVLMGCGGEDAAAPASDVASEASPDAVSTGLGRVAGTWVVDLGARAPAELRFLDALFAETLDDEALRGLLAEVEDDTRRDQLAGLLELRTLHPDDPVLAEAKRGMDQLAAITITFTADAMTMSVGTLSSTQPATVVEDTAERLVIDSVREDGTLARTTIALYDDGTIEVAGPDSPPLPFRRAP